MSTTTTVADMLRKYENRTKSKKKVSVKKLAPPSNDIELHRDRLFVACLRCIKGKPASAIVKGTEKTDPKKQNRPVSTGTIRSWRKDVKEGGVRSPHMLTVNRVLQANDLKLCIGPAGTPDII